MANLKKWGAQGYGKCKVCAISPKWSRKSFGMWNAPLNPKIARYLDEEKGPTYEGTIKELESIRDTIKEEGVELIEYPIMNGISPGIGARDIAVVLDEGVVICNMSLPVRRAEPRIAAKVLVDLGIPILMTVHGNGIFEGGNCIWIDNKTLAVGISLRTNKEGLEQVRSVVKEISIIPVVLPGGFVHLDCVFGIIDKDLAVCYPKALPYEFLEWLKQREIRMIELNDEEVEGMASNILTVRHRRVITSQTAANKKLEKEGVDVIALDLRNCAKWEAGVHCATCEILREKE